MTSASSAASLVSSFEIVVGVSVVVVVDSAPSVPSPGTSTLLLVGTSIVVDVVVCTTSAVVAVCPRVVVVSTKVVVVGSVVVVDAVVVVASVVVVGHSPPGRVSVGRHSPCGAAAVGVPAPARNNTPAPSAADAARAASRPRRGPRLTAAPASRGSSRVPGGLSGLPGAGRRRPARSALVERARVGGAGPDRPPLEGRTVPRAAGPTDPGDLEVTGVA